MNFRIPLVVASEKGTAQTHTSLFVQQRAAHDKQFLKNACHAKLLPRSERSVGVARV